jgi:hypothetical protein
MYAKRVAIDQGIINKIWFEVLPAALAAVQSSKTKKWIPASFSSPD